MEIICFHNPDEENGYLSNWYPFTFALDGVKDQIWGIGLSMKDENRFDLDKWKGQNLLGYALMMVREQFSYGGR